MKLNYQIQLITMKHGKSYAVVSKLIIYTCLTNCLYIILFIINSGVIVPGGFGTRGVEGKIEACKWCRENRKPFLGICLGLQVAVIEFARYFLNYQTSIKCVILNILLNNNKILKCS